MPIDFNTAEPQRSGDLIPDNELVPVHMTIRPGGFGEGGWLKRNQAGNGLMLNAEFTVIEGPHARRKFWTLLTVEGETEGQLKAADITRSRVRAILESAAGIDPTDESDKAAAARRIDTYADLDGIRFWAVVGLEKGEGQYRDKNVLKAVATPDRKGWSRLEQAPRKPAQPSGQIAGAQAAKTSGRPSWAA